MLDIFAHGQHTWQALRDHSRYQLIGKSHGKVGQRACSLPNRILESKVTIGSWGGSQITAATAQFFRDVESLACGDGVIVRFIGCNTATGRRGRKMLGEVHAITHSPVYGYEGDVYPPFDFLWHQISVPAPPPLAPVPISVYTFYN